MGGRARQAAVFLLPASPLRGLALPCSGPSECGVTPDKVAVAAWP